MIKRLTKPIPQDSKQIQKKSPIKYRKKRLDASANGTSVSLAFGCFAFDLQTKSKVDTCAKLPKAKVQKMKQTHRQTKPIPLKSSLVTMSPLTSSKQSQEPNSTKPTRHKPELQPPTTNRSKPLKRVKPNLALSVNGNRKTKKTSKTTQIEETLVKNKSKIKHMKIINPTHKSKQLVSKVNDTLSDMLTRIRNSQQAKHNTVKIIYTKLNLKIIRLLKNEGFIKQGLRSRSSNKPYIMVYLKYLTADKIPCISKLHRISSPGLRHYVGYKDLPKVLNGMGVSVLTTPKGILTDKQARRQKVGGELLFEIY
jgi:small subunit ribosomal protein S8